MNAHPARREDGWEIRAIRIAAALDLATDELAALIEDIRMRYKNEQDEEPSDARPKS